jgi:hypothetical protein
MERRPFFDIEPEDEIYELLGWDLPGFIQHHNVQHLPSSPMQAKGVRQQIWNSRNLRARPPLARA